MQMNLRCGGDFTTNVSVVDQISKRQDLCRVSFKILQLLLAFVLRKLLRDDVLLLINCFRLLRQKIASKGEGRKPSSNREKYIAESEFALLGIPSKNV